MLTEALHGVNGGLRESAFSAMLVAITLRGAIAERPIR